MTGEVGGGDGEEGEERGRGKLFVSARVNVAIRKGASNTGLIICGHIDDATVPCPSYVLGDYSTSSVYANDIIVSFNIVIIAHAWKMMILSGTPCIIGQ